MLKEAPDIKINYAKLGRQSNCDPRTIKKHVEAVSEERPVSTRVYHHIKDNLEDGMSVESEEILDDNSILLTINLN